MNDERAMILTMLREGKISVAEADALLDVLNDDAGAGGFSAARPGGSPAPDQPGDDAKPSGDDAKPSGDDAKSGGRGADFRFDFDAAGLSDGIRAVMGSVRETMSGVSETLKNAFSEFGDLDIHFDLDQGLGKRRVEDTRRLSTDAGSSDRLHVSNVWGDLRVRGGSSDAIAAEVRVTAWAATEEEAATRLRSITVDLVERDGAIVVDVTGAERKTRIDIDVTVPRRFGVTASSASGDVWIEEVDGAQSVRTASGDISVASVGASRVGHHVFSSKSGSIVAASLSGEVDASSASGDIRVDGFDGALSVSSQSGDVHVTDGTGSVECKSVSGDVSLSMRAPETMIAVTSVSGDVVVRVPRDAAIDVHASTISGDISSELPLADERRARRSLSGRMNSGGIAATVSTVSGDASLRLDSATGSP
ncbi:MAG: hypothetical protein EA382_14525 [Spirochaetaceae bacterium]|nr:MAG: hypothetical protein EA382_14525 [Spirochaetaceae bacterium]